MSRRGLEKREEAFCQEYLIDFNQTRAAKRAGYEGNHVAQQGHLLIKKPKVAARVEELIAERKKRLEFDQDRVLNEIAAIAFGTLRPVVSFNADGTPFIDISDATQDEMGVISSIEVDTYMDGKGDQAREVKSVKVKLYDKLSALDKLAKHLGLTNTKLEITMDADTAQLLMKARNRIEQQG